MVEADWYHSPNKHQRRATCVVDPQKHYGPRGTRRRYIDSTGKLYSGLRGWAYYSGRAVMWINTLATCKSEGFARRLPLPRTRHNAPGLGIDLIQLLQVNVAQPVSFYLMYSLSIDQ